MNLKYVLPVVACMAASVALSACSSSELQPISSPSSQQDLASLMLPKPQDRLAEWSSEVPLETNHPFANSLGIDVSTMTRPDPMLMIVKQAEAVAPYGTE
ncbi:hypothetical protein KDA14_05365, partial [Candidatus Saccharibacteria bacterium]|nr:hypothetical protein [Candidatus Saccharibacteria bacterium]